MAFGFKAVKYTVAHAPSRDIWAHDVGLEQFNYGIRDCINWFCGYIQVYEHTRHTKNRYCAAMCAHHRLHWCMHANMPFLHRNALTLCNSRTLSNWLSFDWVLFWNWQSHILPTLFFCIRQNKNSIRGLPNDLMQNVVIHKSQSSLKRLRFNVFPCVLLDQKIDWVARYISYDF